MQDQCNPFPPFHGRDRLIAAVDHAVQHEHAHQIAATLRAALREAIADSRIQLPACVHHPIEDHYARRELYRSPVHGYSIVAMSWGPGQGTPLHDHSGLWCVEGVWLGQLEITQYQLLERDGERFRFRAQPPVLGDCGSAGSLIPPHEYHTLRNTSDDDLAISVHVYQGEMTRSAIFEPEADGWYQRRVQVMETDAA
ncbi:cysteine dioxygenase family protein [Stenotrophomonas sp.]|jgi:predicted metal-dependent enzyme (double-stranded beta helix superfamily)|uniref:cysteine dioxygenase family protein n=1 Tax=Stenotrophomonas sp. TaxID=69392 RepID=UPI0029A2E457|nr:cysteine dioxygenase family protein [Stenotrophomonas sp.]MDX3936255.1 cysteine dioxygenase family protein [Stenotrophomonas sp.]